MEFVGKDISALRTGLLDMTQPIAKRTHAAFILRTMGTEEAADILCEALCQREDSSLMRHELAYVIGQLQFPKFCPQLAELLACETEDTLVRHESAESLGAIGDPAYLPILTQFSTHDAPEIAETCQIAIDLIKWKQQRDVGASEEQRQGTSGGYLSHDPAPPLTRTELQEGGGAAGVDSSSFPHDAPLTVAELRAVLLDPSRSLFHRYRAMFSLRNANSDAAALAIADGFADTSALFRHEIAYVLGQMQRRATIDSLTAVLRKTSEHAMVRHEAAEALGAIGGEETEKVLREYESDAEAVVRESAQVALDTMDYWNTFQDAS